MHFTDLRVYNDALEIGERVWNTASKWNVLAKDTVGKQFIRSADSIAANISEGFGGYYYSGSK